MVLGNYTERGQECHGLTGTLAASRPTRSGLPHYLRYVDGWATGRRRQTRVRSMLLPPRTRHVSELESSGCQSCDCFRSAHVTVNPLLLKAQPTSRVRPIPIGGTRMESQRNHGTFERADRAGAVVSRRRASEQSLVRTRSKRSARKRSHILLDCAGLWSDELTRRRNVWKASASETCEEKQP
jgi:hypothetical protein